MSPGLLLLLRLVHIVVGVFWVGAVAFVAFFLVPSLEAAGPAGGAVMRQLTQQRRMPAWLSASGGLTILAGLLLYWHDSGGFSSAEWMRSGPGLTFGVGAVLAIAGIGVGTGVNVPAARELGVIMARAQVAGGAPAPDDLAAARRLQARLATGARVSAVLLLLAAAAMSVARYVG
jgi:uncharacterized membrane protein